MLWLFNSVTVRRPWPQLRSFFLWKNKLPLSGANPRLLKLKCGRSYSCRHRLFATNKLDSRSPSSSLRLSFKPPGTSPRSGWTPVAQALRRASAPIPAQAPPPPQASVCLFLPAMKPPATPPPDATQIATLGCPQPERSGPLGAEPIGGSLPTGPPGNHPRQTLRAARQRVPRRRTPVKAGGGDHHGSGEEKNPEEGRS